MNECKHCKALTTNKIYCSNTCKFSDKQYNLSRVKTCKNTTGNVLKCKICGWQTRDIYNKGGHALKHLKQHGNQYTLSESYDLVYDNKLNTVNSIRCPECDWKTKDISNKSGQFTSHIKNAHQYSIDTFIQKYPEYEYLWFRYSQIQLKRQNDFVECKICNKYFEKISNTHLLTHGVTMTKYKELFPGAVTINSRLHKLHSDSSTQSNSTRSYSYVSKAETEIADFLKSNNITVIQSYKKLGIELDIFLPEYNIAIEYNGLRYHSEIFGKKHKTYHINKTNICLQHNIQLIHIFEDEYVKNKTLIFSKLLYKCNKISIKLHARKLTCKQISYSVAKDFLDRTHIQQSVKSSINYGLFSGDLLVAVASFSKLRKSLGQTVSDKEIELLRYSTELNTNVRGGMMKIVKQFKRDFPIYTNLISYADKRWSSTITNVYNTSGFELVKDNGPNYWYVLGNIRYHRFNFTKSRIVKSLNGDSNKTEIENMIDLGYDRIWDCGTLKYKLNLK